MFNFFNKKKVDNKEEEENKLKELINSPEYSKKYKICVSKNNGETLYSEVFESKATVFFDEYYKKYCISKIFASNQAREQVNCIFHYKRFNVNDVLFIPTSNISKVEIVEVK